jgi:hypothetical protein
MGTVVVPLAVLPQFIVTGSDYVEVLDLGSY